MRVLTSIPLILGATTVTVLQIEAVKSVRVLKEHKGYDEIITLDRYSRQKIP